jgi:hypothetical protein
LKRFAAAAFLALASSFAHATSYSTDASDLWYIPAEDGWGLNISQQEATLFATLFVYGTDGKPTWFVSSNLSPVAAGSTTFSGDLFATTGPAFAATWNPSLRTNRKVGTATFAFDTVATATFTYVVDNVTVTKHVVRQTWQNDVISGSYAGVLAGVFSGCAANGYGAVGQVFTITQANGTAVSITVNVDGSTSCKYDGTYVQTGHFGAIAASGTCGSFQAQEVHTTFAGITMQVGQTFQGSCRLDGGVAGVRQ